MHTNIASQKLSHVYRVYKLREHVIVIIIREFLPRTRISAMLAELSVCQPKHYTSHLFGGEETITCTKTRVAFWCLWTLVNIEPNNWDGSAVSMAAGAFLAAFLLFLPGFALEFCNWECWEPFLPLPLANPVCTHHIW